MKVPKAIKLPSGSWFIQLRFKNGAVYITRPTEKECVRAAELAKAEHRSDKRKEASAGITVSQAIDKYIADRKNTLSPTTIKGYKSIQAHRFQDVMNKTINAPINWQAEANKEAAKKSAKTVKNNYSLLKAALENCGVAMPKITYPQIVKNPHEYLTWQQIPKFLEIVKGQDCEIAVLLGLHSLRRSEMLALEKSSIYDGIIHLRGSAVVGENMELIERKENKNITSRRDIPIMIQRLQEVVDAAPDGKLITCYPTTMYNQINKICEKNGFPKIGVHGLRHSFASLAHHVGLSETEAMEIGGWSDRNTMHKIYEHLDKEDRLHAINKMAEFYKNANENANESKK